MELRKFLAQAKIAAYASRREGDESILEDGCKELTFEGGEFKYRDRYFGFNPFIDEENVWQNGKILWSMNYYGRIISDIVPAKHVYQFLQKAMRQVSEDRPFRGPNNFKDADFEYIDESEGTIENFRGTEIIRSKGQEIYRLDYHGGFIKSK